MKSVIYSAGPLTTKFFVEPNARKSFKEFYEHEKHIGYTREQLKEAYDLICKAAKGGKPEKVQPPQPEPEKEPKKVTEEGGDEPQQDQ